MPPDSHPRWLTVLTVSPASASEVSMGSVASGIGNIERSLAGAHAVRGEDGWHMQPRCSPDLLPRLICSARCRSEQELSKRVESLESQLALLTAKLATASDLVQSLTGGQQGAALGPGGSERLPQAALSGPSAGRGTEGDEASATREATSDLAGSNDAPSSPTCAAETDSYNWMATTSRRQRDDEIPSERHEMFLRQSLRRLLG